MSSRIHPTLESYVTYMLKQYRENNDLMKKTQHTIVSWIKDNNFTNEEAAKRIQRELVNIIDQLQGVTTEEYQSMEVMVNFVATALKMSAK